MTQISKFIVNLNFPSEIRMPGIVIAAIAVVVIGSLCPISVEGLIWGEDRGKWEGVAMDFLKYH
jgi:hypothetical protein